MFVVVVWFCRLSSLAFLISTYLINLMHHFLLLSYLLWRLSFRSYTSFFLKNTWIFCVFPSVPHLVDNYAKIVDERGRNLMCDRSLPSRLVCFKPGCWNWLNENSTLPCKTFQSLSELNVCPEYGLRPIQISFTYLIRPTAFAKLFSKIHLL